MLGSWNLEFGWWAHNYNARKNSSFPWVEILGGKTSYLYRGGGKWNFIKNWTLEMEWVGDCLPKLAGKDIQSAEINKGRMWRQDGNNNSWRKQMILFGHNTKYAARRRRRKAGEWMESWKVNFPMGSLSSIQRKEYMLLFCHFFLLTKMVYI